MTELPPNKPLDRQTLLNNKLDRECADGAMELLVSQYERVRFFECLRDLIDTKIRTLGATGAATIQTSKDPAVMTEEEAQVFQNTVVFPQGKHKGTKVTEVPCSYILWWSDGDAFSKELRRYVRSRLFERRQDEADEDYRREHGQYSERDDVETENDGEYHD